MRLALTPAIILACFAPISASGPETLEVGPDRAFKRIEDAVAKAKPGDVILVHPQKDNKPYLKVALYLQKKDLTLRSAAKDGERVKLSGEGYDYSGRGSIPRAIAQFNPGADGCIFEGFELSGAHNESHNGAGIRINQANHVTIRHCEIHHNDMGIMSNGDGSLKSAVNQRIENCVIHHNGDEQKPGYNHNLYLGGASVTLRFCDVHSSLTGHNVKSRAHFTRVEYCAIHDSSNREFDLVDADETAQPNSHAVLLGNVIVKDKNCKGNKAVIHFGQDGGKARDGILHLIHNTIVTPFISPVIDLSAGKAKAHLTGNIVCDGGANQKNQVLCDGRAGANSKNTTGDHNWFTAGFADLSKTGLNPGENTVSKEDPPPFVDAKNFNYRLAQAVEEIVNRGAGPITLPETPGAPKDQAGERPLSWQYKHPALGEKRGDDGKPTLGAYEYHEK